MNPADRLTNLNRKLNDLLMSRRLAADSERTGVVELGDFGLRCERLANFAGQSVAELGAANAVFRYLFDLMQVQRATGHFDYFRSPEERQDFLQKLNQFFIEQDTIVGRQ